MKALDNGTDLAGIKGLLYKQDGKVIANPVQDEALDLDTLPLLPYQLINFADYSGWATQSFRSNIFSIESGRGCRHACSFCSTPVISNKRRRILSARGIIDKILHIKKFTAFDGMRFIDPSFLSDKERVFEFIRLLKQNGLKVIWSCEANINAIF